jgi:hypothetical protein
MKDIRAVAVRVHDVGPLPITQLLDQRSLFQVSAWRKDQWNRRHTCGSERSDKGMLAYALVGHDRDNHLVAATHLASSEGEHDRLETAYFTGSNDLKNCPLRTVVARHLGAIYRYLKSRSHATLSSIPSRIENVGR